ncbi:hypothetical protein UB46_25320 [Burkholderiaceae bacterium 16]|nr:hypothetical protein UB46_25320 [Burkholderiaceae bacterium 16]
MKRYIAAPDRTRSPDPAECCSLTPREVMGILGIKLAGHSEGRPVCNTVVHVGLFFDGTNNNMERDYEKPEPAKRFHSNIVRLHNAYPRETENTPGASEYFYRFYLPGVGTPFPQIGEMAESTYGRAFAAGGQARILWGLLQIYNAVHRAAFGGQSMMTDEEIAAKIKDYERRVDHQQRPDPEDPPRKRKDWFVPLTQELSKKLRAKLDVKRLPRIPLVSVSVFGFSRGAVQARAFCYWFQDALQDGKFAGIDTDIRFLGLFDSVATVGTSDSMHHSLGLPRWLASGHSGWAAEILKPLPALVKKTVHYISAHEQHMNFPVTRIVGGQNVEEVLYPGMHSDVGGRLWGGRPGQGTGWPVLADVADPAAAYVQGGPAGWRAAYPDLGHGRQGASRPGGGPQHGAGLEPVHAVEPLRRRALQRADQPALRALFPVACVAAAAFGT